MTSIALMIPSAASESRLDSLDRAILGALAVRGRGSWAVIAEVAGSSPSTVQRRFARLQDEGLARVIGTVDVLAAGLGISVMVRINCGSVSASKLAERLKSRPEVRFVSTVTGTADCVAEIVLLRLADLQPFLSELFPEAGIHTEALPVLRTFTVPFQTFPGTLESALTRADPAPGPVRTTAARGAGHPNAVAPDLDESEGVVPVTAAISPTERRLVSLLIADGRRPVVELARELDRTELSTRRAIDALLSSGTVRIGPLISPTVLRLETELMIWISVAPELLSAAARQLARHPAVHFAAASAGRYNLVGQAFLANFGVAYDFTTSVLGALPGVREVDVTVQMTTHKRMWTAMDGDRFDGPTATII